MQNTKASAWIFSPAWDSFSMLSGITLCFILLCLRPFGLDEKLMLVFVASERFVALSHSWSTTYLVTCSKVFKPLRAERRDIFLTIPILIFIMSLILGVLVSKTAMIQDDGSIDRAGALLYLYIGLFMFGHFWHFGRQDFGVLSAYRQKAKQFTPQDRNIDRLYAQIMMYLVQPTMYVYVFVHYPFTNIVGAVFPLNWSGAAAQFALVVALTLYIRVMVGEFRKVNRSTPKLIYYTIMFFHPTFLYFSGVGFMSYWYMSYLWSHWLIATTLAGRVHVSYHVRAGRSLRWAMLYHILAVLGVIALVCLLTQPFLGSSILGKDFVTIREVLRLIPPARMVFVGLFFGFMLGEQLVHYYCDRWLFRFKDERVRAVVAPLL